MVGCVAQLVEWSLPIPEVRGTNPVVGKKILYWKDENKEKEAGIGPFFKKTVPRAPLKVLPQLFNAGQLPDEVQGQVQFLQTLQPLQVLDPLDVVHRHVQILQGL